MSYGQPSPRDVGGQRANTIFNQIVNVVVDLLPSTAGMVVMLIGLAIVLAGFVAFAYPVVDFILTIFSALQRRSPEPPDLSGVNFGWIPVGIGATLVGMFTMAVGFMIRRRSGRMTDDRRGGNFNITNQYATSIYNFMGDLYVAGPGGQPAASVDVWRELYRLQVELGRLSLSPEARTAADAALEGVAAELRAPEPNRPRLAERLRSATQVLQAAGALVQAGTAIAEPLSRLQDWLTAVH